jgi:hypothetical protein
MGSWGSCKRKIKRNGLHPSRLLRPRAVAYPSPKNAVYGPPHLLLPLVEKIKGKKKREGGKRS